jgi:hypothetical protein
MHGVEKCVHADKGFTGVEKRAEFEGGKVEWMMTLKMKKGCLK